MLPVSCCFMISSVKVFFAASEAVLMFHISIMLHGEHKLLAYNLFPLAPTAQPYVILSFHFVRITNLGIIAIAEVLTKSTNS